MPRSTLQMNTEDNPRTLIELRDVLKVYETPAGGFTALKNVDLKVNAGEFVAVIGKSGSGKSTLINMITGIDRPTLGEVIIGDEPIHKFNEDQMAKWRGLNLGVIFQFFQLLPTLTVLENVMLPMELRQTYPQAQRKERALQLLERVELESQAYKFPSAISGGQQQRVAIARALANEPDVLVGDEPTGSLDSKTADSIFQLFEEFVSQGKTILIVTHDRELAGRVPRVVFIDDGEITDQYVAQALPTMTQQGLAMVSSQLEPIKFAPGEVIIQQGDPANSFYIIVRGTVDILLRHPTGVEVLTGQLGPGQYFGEIGLLEGGTRTATVKANEDSEVVVMQLHRENFAKIVAESELTHTEILHLMRQRVMEQRLSVAMPSLDQDQLSAIVKKAEVLELEANSVVVHAGQPTTKTYIIIDGNLDVLNAAGDVIRQAGESDSLWTDDIVRDDVFVATLRTAGPVNLIALDTTLLNRYAEGQKMNRGDTLNMISREYLESILGDTLPNLRRRHRKIDIDFEE